MLPTSAVRDMDGSSQLSHIYVAATIASYLPHVSGFVDPID
jgi:hypothetical protein